MFRLACTVQPKARAAGDTVTVAGSGLTGTPARPKNAPDGDADSAGVPDHQVRRLPHLDLALGARHHAGGRISAARARIPILMTITKRNYGATSLLSGRIIRGPIRPAFCLDAPLRPAQERWSASVAGDLALAYPIAA